MNDNRNNAFSFGDFVWFTAIIEDVNDPEKLGRVKARIFGYHIPDKNELPTEKLPWAMIALPISGASTNGIGFTAHGLIKDAHVIGFFVDGKSAQLPMILFSFPGKTEDGIPDINKLARGETIKKTMDNAGNWSEKSSGAAPIYPHNKVIETTSGHIIEIDDTPGKERLHVYHKSGTYTEYHTDGTLVNSIKGTNYHIVIKDYDIHVHGNCNLNVDGNMVETIKGNKTSNISGSYTINCRSYNLKTQTTYNANIGSSAQFKASGQYTQKAAVIFLN